MPFPDLHFQQDNAPVHKLEIIRIFSKKRSERYWNSQELSTDHIWFLLTIYGRFWSSDYKNRQFLGKIQKKKCQKFEQNWLRRREKYLWKLYKPSARRLNRCNNALLENKFELTKIHYFSRQSHVSECRFVIFFGCLREKPYYLIRNFSLLISENCYVPMVLELYINFLVLKLLQRWKLTCKLGKNWLQISLQNFS